MPTRWVPRLTFALNRRMHGLGVRGFHVLNLAIHVAAALLVWRLARLLLRCPAPRTLRLAAAGDWIAAFAGAIFVVHPLQTQAVTYIVQRDASLAALFYLGAMVCYAKARALWEAPARSAAAASWYGGVLVCALCGVFSKATVLTLPGAVVLLEFCLYPAEWRGVWKRALPVAFVVALLPATLLSRSLGTSSVPSLERVAQQVDRVSYAASGISRREYGLTQARVVVRYLRLLAIPTGQSIEHYVAPTQGFGEPRTLLALIGLLGLAGTGLWLRRRAPLSAFAILWFFLTLSIESSVFPVADMMAEHRLYLPMVGYAVLLPVTVFQVFLSGRFAHKDRTLESSAAAELVSP
jgi:hypothetical protein